MDQPCLSPQAIGSKLPRPSSVTSEYNNNNNNNNQYIYKQRQSHAMSQRRWLATAVIFRPSDVSLGFAET